MQKLKQIGEYVINPANIAYIEIWLGDDGLSKGSKIIFNSYAAAANSVDWGYEPLSVEISGINPIEIMDFVNMDNMDRIAKKQAIDMYRKNERFSYETYCGMYGGEHSIKKR